MKKFSLFFLALSAFFLVLSLNSCTKKTEDAVKDKQTAEKEEDKEENAVYKVELGTSVFKGPENAPVTIVNFSDFQCPFSKRSVEAMEKIMKNYDGKVRYVYKHFPLGFHKMAKPAALASIAAQKQGKFWEYYNRLFEDIKKTDPDNLVLWAKELGLDMEKFEADRNSEEAGRILQDDMAMGSRFGVRGTPTLFINGHKIVGANVVKIEETLVAQIAEGEKLKAKGVANIYEELTKNGLAKYIPPKRKPETIPQDIFKVEIPTHSPVWGSTDADITVVLFDDFECPFCSRLFTTFEQLKKDYEGKLHIAFINYPLKFHKKAIPAAYAAIAAGKQGKFWEMYSALFSKQKEWKAASDMQKWFEDEAVILELDTEKFKKDMESASARKIVEEDVKIGEELGIRGTPASFVNGRFVSGSLPYNSFKQVIDEELKKAEEFRSKGLSGHAMYLEITKDGLSKIPHGNGAKDEKIDPDKVYDIKLTGKEPVKGNKKASLTIIEFSEHECPFCKRGSAVIDEVIKDYNGKVNLVFKHMPLSFHKEARPAALFTIAIKNIYGDEKFFAMSSILFSKQNEWKTDYLAKFETYSKEMKLDWKKIKTEMDKPETELVLKEDMTEAAKNNIRGVPAFFIKGKMLTGAKSKESFKAIIDNLLK
ncbi:MAG TPA: thioredoxin domain-containing protein [bacterium]|nr:thioredoxin domain-containing protein [bacterium]